MIDWSILLACDVCPALLGDRCYLLSSGGPQALAPQFADRPHSTRKVSGSQVARLRSDPATRLRAPQMSTVARRASRTRNAEVAAWTAKGKRGTDG